MAGLLPSFSFPKVVAHRGASGNAPENTLAAFRRAAACGASAVEFDVKLSADGVPVVIHDGTVDRTTNGAGPVAAYTADQLSHLDAGTWFAPAFSGEGVPTLAAALAFLIDAGLACNIEFKPDPGTAAATAQATLDVATAAWPADRPPPLLSAFDPTALDQARATAPNWPRAILVRGADHAAWLAAARNLDCVAVHADNRHTDRPAIEKIHTAGFAAGTHTVNDPDRARDLWQAGLDYLITDDPAALLKTVA